MPTVQLATVPERDFGGGIDQQSPPNQIKPGYVEEALDADPQPTGGIRKRAGYQGFAGNIPVRVKEISGIAATDILTLVFETSIDLSTTRGTPLIIRGKLSGTGTGDFTSGAISTHYYSTLNSNSRKVFLTGPNTLTIPATESGIATAQTWTGVAQSTEEVANSNLVIFPDRVSINKSTFSVAIDYNNQTGSTFNGFVYFKDQSEGPTTTYFGDDAGNAGATVAFPSGGTTTYSISAGEHLLSASTIIAKVFQDDGTSYIEIQPDSVTINKATSLVQIAMTNNSGSSINIIFSLSVAPTANFTTGAVASLTTQTISIDLTPYADATNFVFTACYLDNGITLTQVLPDSIEVDAQLNTLDITFTDSGAGGGNFSIYWEFASVTSNKFTIQSSIDITADFTDLSPQLTVWGLDHSEIYSMSTNNSAGRAGWTTYIDSYRSAGEERIISGLGGVLFAAREQAEDTTLLMPTLYPNLEALVSTDTVVGPVFWETGETPNRTRGYITADTGASNFFEIASITWDSGLSLTKIVLTAPNIAVVGTLSTIIATTGLRDQLLIEAAGFRIHEGSFDIHQVTVGTDVLNIWVDNSLVDSSDWDILGAGGFAGVFTDRIPLIANSPFIATDIIHSDLFLGDLSISVLASSGMTLLVDGIVDLLGLPTGLKLVGERSNSSIIPLRTSGGTPSVTNLVRGDMLTYTGIARELRIKNINELADVSVTIAAGDGTEAIVTVLSGNTSTLWSGEHILLLGGATYSGEYIIASVLSSTTFTIASTLTTSDSATMAGNTIQVDESFTWQDTTTNSIMISVPRRWDPIESPDSSATFDLVPSTHYNYFRTNSYIEQPILRSSMVKDSLFLANGDDEIFKFDGTNNYRAGLPRFQLQSFISVDTSSTGKIALHNPTAATSAHSQNRITLTTIADKGLFRVGDELVYALDGLVYTVQEIQEVLLPSAAYIYLDRAITVATSSSSVSRLSVLKYYFRLNAVDANNNIVASAITGSDDSSVRLSVDAGVRIRMLTPPAWDIYDYERIEAQVYRTASNTQAPFYSLTTIPLNFDANSGYFDYLDTAADSDLLDLDAVSTALLGQELGTGWSEPLRAKSVTSAGNSLVLANIKDYPTLDIQMTKNTDKVASAAFAGLKFLLRKDNTDTGTVTNMVDRATYELRDTANRFTVVPSLSTITSTTATIDTGAPHGAVAGSWVYFYRNVATTTYNPRLAGWFQVVSVTTGGSNTVTVNTLMTDTTSPLTASDIDSAMFATVRSDIPVVLGQDYNYQQISGNKDPASTYEFIVFKRLGDAINASMRQTTTASFNPWIIAGSGNDFDSAQLVLKQPKVVSTVLEMKLPAFPATMSFFVNSIRRVASAEVSAITKLFPSRLIVSYPNFPEIFDAPTVVHDIDSASAIDVNPADGQEITAVIPFFGDSAFGAALKGNVVVVFKTNSIYLVDLAAKASGINPVQKIESQGKGCTAPYSVASSRDAIVFVNDSGIYRLNSGLKIDYHGRKYEKKFKTQVDKPYLDLATATHNGIANLYKLSYVTPGNRAPSDVAVYNHTREYEVMPGGEPNGAWSTYRNHPSIGWANLNSDSFFASTSGRVFINRSTNTLSDFRDDSSAIAFSVSTRANDFGDGGIRKIVRSIISHFIGTNSTGTTLTVARDLVDNFDPTDAFRIHEGEDTTSLSDTGEKKVNTIRSTINSSKAVYFQLKYTNETYDEDTQLVGVDWRVAGLSSKGITEAGET